MIKADLARIVYERHGGISYCEAKDLVEIMIDRIKASLVSGSSVKLSGFGSFNVVRRKGTLGTQPANGRAHPARTEQLRDFSTLPNRQVLV